MNDNTYTCPMHPEIRQIGPGTCPLCGMALDRIKINDQEENPELIDFNKRFWMGLLFTIPIVLLEMGGHFIDISSFISNKNNLYLQFILSVPVILWSGMPFFIRAYSALLKKRLNMFSLISMGTGVAFLYSMVALFFVDAFPASFRNMHGNIPVYFESASVIIILVLLGQIVELKAREKTGGAIKLLMGLAPKSAKIITKSGDQDVLIEEIKVGDQLRIRPGEKIPIDGVVVEGSTYIDESMITGEPVPVPKNVNNFVIGGTINTNGSIIMRATKIGSETMLASIIQMVVDAQRSRAPIQRLADLISGWFVPVVILIAFLSFMVWIIFGGAQGFSYGLISSVSVLIIACPCALGLATPMSIMVGIGRGAKNGILIKDAQSLEVLEKVNTIIIDKTGTLTEGKPSLSKIYIHNNAISENNFIQIAASIEQNSEHPLAQSIIKFAQEKELILLEVKNFRSITGQGVSGVVNDQEVFIGNMRLMKILGISMDESYKAADEERRKGATVIFLSTATTLMGFIVIHDEIKKSAILSIKALKKLHMNIIMLTGDNYITAKSVANQLGITSFHSEVLPEDKAKIVKEYQDKGFIVAMAGDGINDAPALSSADVGIAMGSGTDVAIESSGVTLVKGDLLRLVGAIKLSHAVMNNIRQNLFLAFVYNVAGIPIAAGILYPFFGVLLSPIFAAAAMSLSSLSVISNALRLNFTRID